VPYLIAVATKRLQLPAAAWRTGDTPASAGLPLGGPNIVPTLLLLDVRRRLPSYKRTVLCLLVQLVWSIGAPVCGPGVDRFEHAMGRARHTEWLRARAVARSRTMPTRNGTRPKFE
jgi:hypothetical protein